MNQYEKLAKELEIAKQRVSIKEKELREAIDEKAKVEEKVMDLLLNGEKPEKQVIELTDMEIKALLKDIKEKGFTADGCNCGRYGMQIREELGLEVYRSCYKSSSTPNEKMWQIHKIGLFKKVTPVIETYSGGTYIENYEAEEELPFELTEAQTAKILNRLRRESIRQTRQPEYRD